MSDTRQNFIDAQKKMLDRYGVVTESLFKEVASVNGKAHVLTCGKGPAVVMINGIGTPGAMWAPLMAELSEYRLNVIDLPRFGLTDFFPDFAEDTRGNAVRFLSEVLDELHLRHTPIISNSLGSLCASWLAMDTDRVSALVHVGCPAIVLGTSAPLPMRLLSSRFLGKLLTRLQPPSRKQVIQLSKMVNEHPMVSELVDLLVATERLDGFHDMFLSTLSSLITIKGNRPELRLSRDQLSAIDHPTLIFWGEKEPMGSIDVGRRMAETMPRAELHIVGGGHAPWLTQSKTIAPILKDFLQDHLQ